MTDPDEAPALRIRGLDVDLAGRPVLRQVDLDVSRGELVALLGANGSGKSTIVRSAVGLVPRRSGTIELFGTPLESFTHRHRLGYVPQRSSEASGVPASVREVVMSGRLSLRRFLGPARRADRDAVEAAVAKVGLGDHLTTPVTELSGGQHQRALIARALVTDPDLLVMDEPTAGVDQANTEALADLLATFTAAGGAVLLVEHELGPLRPVVDRAVVVDRGRITFAGVPAAAPEDDAHGHPHSGAPPRLSPFPGEAII
ncbi:ABC transporter, ATP-binding protein [Aeromicrobium marinum DSM 15272]|uniref:ABC transporter, ATP-binding protein n=1 Tax=Aeromicrobium marinum DSM 15272 TaxID=585531 RepID=E2SD22_9ACTN|nr:metal ABC transporter ATP-binding protein [Aeromicrobium marinum]EFQ83125.1 ABC transporter, ATP-binding protein [Aeromicrobium marinum DSM 15272]